MLRIGLEPGSWGRRGRASTFHCIRDIWGQTSIMKTDKISFWKMWRKNFLSRIQSKYKNPKREIMFKNWKKLAVEAIKYNWYFQSTQNQYIQPTGLSQSECSWNHHSGREIEHCQNPRSSLLWYLWSIPTPFSESESEVPQSCPTLCDPMDYSPPGSSVHAILQARVLEWGASAFSRGSSRPRVWAGPSCTAGRRCTVWAAIPTLK